jgi:hypothetical protein
MSTLNVRQRNTLRYAAVQQAARYDMRAEQASRYQPAGLHIHRRPQAVRSRPQRSTAELVVLIGRQFVARGALLLLALVFAGWILNARATGMLP